MTAYSMKQSVTLPSGKYRAEGYAFYRYGENASVDPKKSYAKFVAGDFSAPVVTLGGEQLDATLTDYPNNTDQASAAFTNGYYKSQVEFSIESESTIAFGYEGTHTLMRSWFIAGPIKLYRTGDFDYSLYQSRLEELVTEAKKYQGKDMNGTVSTTLNNLISSYDKASACSSVAEYSSAFTQLEAVIADAEASVATYAEAKVILEAANIYDSYGQANYAADETIAAIQAAYDAKTLTKITDSQKTAAKAALLTACKAQQQPANGCDMSAFIVNPGIDGNVNGWTCDLNNNGGYVGGPLKPSNDAMEFWAGGTLSEEDKGKSFDYYQTITGLPNGAYTVSASMLNSTNGEENAVWNGGGKAGLYASTASNEVDVRVTTDDETFRAYTTDEILVVSGELRIGVKNFEALTGRWFAVDNFKLTYSRQLSAEDIANAAYEDALAAAKAITEGSITTAAYIGLQQVITNNTLPEGSTAEAYSNATNALNQATEAAAALVGPYATWLELKAQAQALAAEGHATINAAINKVSNAVETIVAADDLNAANTYTASLMTHYVAWDELYNSANVLKDVSNNNETANTTLKSSITTQSQAIAVKFAQLNSAANPTPDMIDQLDNAVESATTALKAAMTTYVTTAEPIKDECFDLTFLIVNPHFKEGQGGKAIPTGWELESGTITEHRLATHNFEAFQMPFNLSQTIPNLKKGTYKVTLQGFARHDNSDVTDKTNLYCGPVNQPIKSIKDEYSTKPLASDQPALGDNNGEASYVLNGETVWQPNGMSGSYYFFQETNPATNKPFYTNEVQTLITEDGDLKIGFKCETTSDWVIWDNFHLYYYGSAIAVALDEETGTSYSKDIDNANVTLKKTIYKGWNTITIPFEATTEAFGADALYKYTGDAEGILNFDLVEDGAIEPNVPYLLSATQGEDAVQTFTFNGVTVKAADGQTTEGTNYDFVGIYQEATVAEGDYILGDDAFYRSKGGNKVKAYRAYVKAKSDDPSNARLKIAINGVVTAIDTIDGQAVNNAAIYNLAGQKVEKAQKGIYIQNGKKVVVR